MASRLKTIALSAAIVGTGIFAIALISGTLYEQAQRTRDRERYPPVGRSVDIGGRTLYIDCAGSGRPTVIFATGATWAFYRDPKSMFEKGVPRPGYSWVAIQRDLAHVTTACWYDRAGSGWSDLGPYPRDSASQARDLHALLQAAGVPPPYVLAAESSAALTARVYTGFYPEDVAALVMVNGVHPDIDLQARFPRFVGHSQDAMAQLFNLVGLYRRGGENRPAPGPPPAGMTASEWALVGHLTQSSKARSALMQDIASWGPGLAQARASGSLGDRPVAVLSSDGPRTDLQSDMARLSTHGHLRVVAERGADLLYQAPGAIIDAIRGVLDELRKRPDTANPRLDVPHLPGQNAPRN